MSAQGRWFVTPHAVRRFRERWRPELTYEQALGELIRISEVAKFRREVSPAVHEYVGPKPGKNLFRVSVVGSGLPQLLTVLSRGRPC